VRVGDDLGTSRNRDRRTKSGRRMFSLSVLTGVCIKPNLATGAMNAIHLTHGDSSAGLGHSVCAVVVLVCVAVSALSSPASAASTPTELRSQSSGVDDVVDQKYCDGDPVSARDDASYSGAKVDTERSASATKERESDDAQTADRTDEDAGAETAHGANSDDYRAHAGTQHGGKTNGCSIDPERADSDSRENDTVDPGNHATLESRLDYYTDSSRYVNITTTSLATAPFEGSTVSLRRDWLQARDPGGMQAVETMTLGFSEELSELWGVGGGFGTVHALRHSDLVGSFHAHFDYRGASAIATIAREMVLESAQAVKLNIRQTDFGLNLSDDLSDRVSIGAEVHHQIYSDGNISNNAALSPDYTFDLPLGKLALGYRFSYTAFAKNPENGYWAPQKALSNGMSAAWSFDRSELYGRTETGISYDSVSEIGTLANGPSSGPGVSAAIAFGIRLIKGTEMETYWSGNGSLGWNSMNVGFSLKYHF
jgi:hypothetical protein